MIENIEKSAFLRHLAKRDANQIYRSAKRRSEELKTGNGPDARRLSFNADPVNEPWYQRLIGEKQQLSERIDSLQSFLKRPQPEGLISDEMNKLLRQQFHVMNKYDRILEARLKLIDRGG